MSGRISIGNRRIGVGQPPYIVAEISANHLGSYERALAHIEMAAEAGADAVKIQTYRPDTITIDHDGPDFQITDGLWRGRCLYELYADAYTPWEWHVGLFEKAREVGITLFSAPFDPTAVDLLAGLDAPAYKIASFEIVDHPLIERVAATGRPIIMSTGLANITQIDEAVRVARNAGCRELALLHCISGYPTPPEDSHLHTLLDMAFRFDAVVGLSDHTLTTAVPVAAVALGANIIEKHVTLSRADGGPDAAFSLEPDELARLVEDCRTAWKALGAIQYGIKGSETISQQYQRSLYVVNDTNEGEVLTESHVRSIRPGYGLPPKHLKAVLGRRAKTAIPRGTPLAWEHLAD